ncbi:MAG: cyclic nucleotide-binding domain-containing protein [Anaerolineaceae bacterium]|nr:cyclic nucleotide-binding domain-containing protein [Anaerolineaceae bacterium]
MIEKKFNKGDVIFREGDDANSFFQIQEGKVEIIINYGNEDEKKLTEMGPGQFFGEMAVVESRHRSATVIAIEDNTIVTEIQQDELDAFFSEQPDKIILMMKNISGRIRELTQDYNEAAETLKDLKEGKSANQNESFFDKIKKFLSGIDTNVQSVEEAEAEHGKGLEGKVASYPAGTIIFKEGETASCMYDIHFGRVGIYSNYGTPDQKEITVLYPNKFFGEMGMIDNETRSATAVTLDDETTIETIDAEDLTELMKQNPPKVNMILMHLSNRLRNLTRDYTKVCKEIADLTA